MGGRVEETRISLCVCVFKGMLETFLARCVCYAKTYASFGLQRDVGDISGKVCVSCVCWKFWGYASFGLQRDLETFLAR